jgi:C4-dicarboxylate transporter DctQ subunit
MGILNKIEEFVDKIFKGAALLLLVGVVVSSSIQVITRYVFNASLTGSEEFARYCAIWMSMLGASICVKYGSHASISFLNDFLKGKTKLIHSIAINLVIIIFAFILIQQGFNIVKVTTTQLSPSLRIPMSYVYLAIPVGAIGMIINAISTIGKYYLEIRKKVK